MRRLLVILAMGLVAGCGATANADCDAKLVEPAVHIDATAVAFGPGMDSTGPVSGTACLNGQCTTLTQQQSPGDLLALLPVPATGQAATVRVSLQVGTTAYEASWSGRVGSIEPYSGTNCPSVAEVDLVLGKDRSLRPGGHRTI
jgi:streptogramin lyase